MQRKIIIPNPVFFAEVQLYLQQGKEVLFPIKGNSMRPFLTNGDKVLLEALAEDVWPLGSILLAKWGDDYVLHRLVKRRLMEIGLAGDDNIVQIEWVKPEAVLAKVKEIHYTNKTKKRINSCSRLLGLIWYYARPIRQIGLKINKIVRGK